MQCHTKWTDTLPTNYNLNPFMATTQGSRGHVFFHTISQRNIKFRLLNDKGSDFHPPCGRAASLRRQPRHKQTHTYTFTHTCTASAWLASCSVRYKSKWFYSPGCHAVKTKHNGKTLARFTNTESSLFPPDVLPHGLFSDTQKDVKRNCRIGLISSI